MRQLEACLAGAGNTERVTQQADRTELYWGRRDEDVVQGQDKKTTELEGECPYMYDVTYVTT